jgi:hypothetical protein
MSKGLVMAGKLLGSAWLVLAAFTAAVLAAIGLPRGPYLGVVLFSALALLCLAGAIMLWRAKSLHWLTVTALGASVAGALYGRLYP